MLSSKMTFRIVFVSGLVSALAYAQQSHPGRRPRSPLPVPTDCNLNGVSDAVDIAQGNSADCNSNLIPDECDVSSVVLLSESFENGLPPGWGAGGQWHVTNQCPRASQCDGEFFAYFGTDYSCVFGNGSLDGFLVVPDIFIPAGAGGAELSFCSAYEGEGQDPYDAADVVVNGVLLDHVSPFPQFDWETRTIDLSAFVGQTVSIQFEFAAMDIVANHFLGWQVDNVRLTAFGVGDPEAECNYNGIPDECEPDCNVNGVPDDCDIAAELSLDCNENGVPDMCDLGTGASEDCNLNLVPDECDVMSSLDLVYQDLQTSHASISSSFTDQFHFTDGITGSCIADGGMNMFDCGNRLGTDLFTGFAYTSGVVPSPLSFGPGSSFFTAKYDGLFVMIADNCSIETFGITGSNGADGLGIVNCYEATISVDSQQYSIYVKRVYGTPEPSVNQLIVVPGDGTGITHTYSADTDLCAQSLDGLTGIDRVFYVLVSRHADGMGLPLRPIDSKEIARKLINSMPAPVSLDENSNGIPDECE